MLRFPLNPLFLNLDIYMSCLYLLYVQLQADQSGTIAEILAEDGKPVSVDTVLYLNHLISYRYELSNIFLPLRSI